MLTLLVLLCLLALLILLTCLCYLFAALLHLRKRTLNRLLIRLLLCRLGRRLRRLLQCLLCRRCVIILQRLCRTGKALRCLRVALRHLRGLRAECLRRLLLLLWRHLCQSVGQRL